MSLDALRREPVTFELNIPYASTGNQQQRLDLYLPKNRMSEKLPVIVFIHGGGWSQGDKSDATARLLPFLRTGGYAGISVGYRLSGEAQWPAQIFDCKAAIRWVRANAAKYGFDPERIGVTGRSAGSHLALMIGVSGDVAALEGDLGPYRGTSSKVAAVANYYGPTDFLSMLGQPSDIDHSAPDAPEALLIGGILGENPEKARAASPVTYVTAADPPILIVHGTADATVPYDQAVRMDEALRKAGVPSYFVTIRGAGHGNFGTAADGRAMAFFDKYLRGMNVEISTATITDWRTL